MRPIERLIAKLKLRGAGDVVALVAQPVARAMDVTLGTHVTGCPGCRKRREALNAAFPLGEQSLDSPAASDISTTNR